MIFLHMGTLRTVLTKTCDLMGYLLACWDERNTLSI